MQRTTREETKTMFRLATFDANRTCTAQGIWIGAEFNPQHVGVGRAVSRKFIVTWPATVFQVAIGVRVEGEINAVKFPTKEEAEAFTAVTVGAEVEKLESIN